MAAMTLLLAHLDSLRYPQKENILAHMYLSDRAMLEQTQDNLEKMSLQDGDNLHGQSSALLERLLAILGEAANGNTHSANSVSLTLKAPETDMEQPDEDNSNTVRWFVPYCGIIRIAREGVISKEQPAPPPSAEAVNNQDRTTSSNDPPTASTSLVETRQRGPMELPFMMWPRAAAQTSVQSQQEPDSDPSTSYDIASTQVESQFPHMFDPTLNQYEYPVLTADLDDWAFQGVDTAFFNSVMTGVDEGNAGGVEWDPWQEGS
jgi:hypothetical protein